MTGTTAPSWASRVDDALRGRPTDVRVGSLLGLLVAFGLVYGAAMGTFTGLWDGRPLQLLYSAVKVPLLLGVSFAVALPSFFALNTILGLRDDFAEAARAVAGAQATLAIVLAALAPLTIWFYAGTTDYDGALLWNGAMFLVAAGAGQVALRRAYRPLVARSPRHKLMMWAWGGCYAFVAIQAAWVLRPFVGAPGRPTQFFRDDMWGNAYVVILQTVARGLG